MSNYGDEDYSPILGPDPQDTGPVDPVFVDEESSGEAVVHAADQDLDFMPPLPEFSDEKPPEPKTEPSTDNEMEIATLEENEYESDSDSFEELDMLDAELEASIGKSVYVD